MQFKATWYTLHTYDNLKIQISRIKCSLFLCLSPYSCVSYILIIDVYLFAPIAAKIETLQDNMRVNIFHIPIILLVVKQGTSRFIPTHNDRHQNVLDIDIRTNLIEFERIAKSIQFMASGGMVSWRRRLITVKLAMRAIVDGIEGDFLETVSTHLLNI